MLDEKENLQIRQQAINKIGIDVLESIKQNVSEVLDNVKSGNSNLSMHDLDGIVQALGEQNTLTSIDNGMRILNCSQAEFQKIAKTGEIRRAKKINKGIYFLRDIYLYLEQKRIKNKKK